MSRKCMLYRHREFKSGRVLTIFAVKYLTYSPIYNFAGFIRVIKKHTDRYVCDSFPLVHTKEQAK